MINKFLFFILIFQGCSNLIHQGNQIDLARREIDGINFMGTLAEIKSQIGNNQLEVLPRDQISDQGDRVIDTLWIITISGHHFSRSSSSKSVYIQDSFFKTAEGVGVGSSVQEFVNCYGVPKYVEEDIGYSLYFESHNLRLSVYITPDCQCEHSFESLDKKCIIENMFILVPA
ncbi:MAG: hypothetical protein NTX44_05145 [Ignavibacteriales bacterium]|nr:hypothetical protein [Ignavibacteriales bacterium]